MHRHYCKRFVNALHTHSQYGGTRLIKTFFQFFIKQLMLPLGYLKQIIQIFFFLFHFISFFGIFMLNRFGLGLIRTNKNGFTNFFVFAKIFDCKVRKIRLHAVLVQFFYFFQFNFSDSAQCYSQRGVTYFANISAKTNLSAEPL